MSLLGRPDYRPITRGGALRGVYPLVASSENDDEEKAPGTNS